MLLKKLFKIKYIQIIIIQSILGLIIANKWLEIVRCYGLTQDPSDKNYACNEKNFREYLRQNHNQLIKKERIKIIVDIINSLGKIHNENAIHKDLHSGNILYLKYNNFYYIGDLGSCGPADKQLESKYGNLPYIAQKSLLEKDTLLHPIYIVLQC
jgi:serine/threonine protein kinase